MNWEALGAISEILAAIAVVVTLAYLAKQIRQNSQAVEIAALRDTTDQWNQWSEVLATSPDLADIVGRRICSPGFSEWWSDNHVDYSGEFVSWINRLADKRD